MKRVITLSGLLLLLFAVIYLGWWRSDEEDSIESVPYRILKDDRTPRVKISVSPCIDNSQLRATLRQAATDLANDPARDYILQDHFWVEAYIETPESGPQLVGIIRRFVPGPEGKGTFFDIYNFILSIVSGRDKFKIMLDEVKANLEASGQKINCE